MYKHGTWSTDSSAHIGTHEQRHPLCWGLHGSARAQNAFHASLNAVVPCEYEPTACAHLALHVHMSLFMFKTTSRCLVCQCRHAVHVDVCLQLIASSDDFCDSGQCGQCGIKDSAVMFSVAPSETVTVVVGPWKYGYCFQPQLQVTGYRKCT